MLSRKKMKLSEIIITIGAVVFFICYFTDISYLWIAGIALMAAGLLAYGRSCRCPKCRKVIRHLSSSTTDPGYCQHCGSKIEFDE